MVHDGGGQCALRDLSALRRGHGRRRAAGLRRAGRLEGLFLPPPRPRRLRGGDGGEGRQGRILHVHPPPDRRQAPRLPIQRGAHFRLAGVESRGVDCLNRPFPLRL